MLLTLTLTGLASAAPVAVQYTPFDLAALEIARPAEADAAELTGPASVAWFEDPARPEETIELHGPCALRLDADALRATEGPASCPALWGNANLPHLRVQLGEATLLLQRSPVSNAQERLSAIAGAGVLTTPPFLEAEELALFDGSAWQVDAPLAGEMPLPEALRNEPPSAVYARSEAGLTRWFVDVVRIELPEPPRPPPAPAGDQPVSCAPPEQEDLVVVCIDATDDHPRTRIYGGNGHVLPPNHHVRVIVHHRSDRRVALDMAGERGLYVPAAQLPTEYQVLVEAMSAGADESTVPTTRVTEQTFAPRKPGDAPLMVTLYEEHGEEPVAQTTVELIVEPTYVGAVRFGVAATFGGAVDAAYEARTAPGSQQPEVAVAQASPVDLELTVGYAPFLDRDGRSARGCQTAPWCFAPYVGFSVLGQSSGKLEFLKAAHLGAEWQVVPDFSIALTGVARRVTRLDDGVVVGTPARDLDVPTHQTLGLGAGLVFNLSPAFLRVAAGL